MTAVAEELRQLAVDLRQGDTELEECWRLPETEYRGSFYENPSGAAVDRGVPRNR